MVKFPFKFSPEALAATDDKARTQAKGWIIRCPAHADDQASLSVTRLDNGFAYFKCFTGCAQEDIAKAFEARGVKNEWDSTSFERPTTRRSKKVTRTTDNLIFDYDGAPVAMHIRYDYEDGTKDFETLNPDGSKLTTPVRDLLYGLELVAEFPDRLVVICEGEKAADALRSIGIAVACGTLGASVVPGPNLIARFRDREVVLWPDADKPGREHMEAWRKALAGIASKVVMIDWKGASPKADAWDWVEAGNQRIDLSLLVKASPSWESPAIPAETRYLWQGVEDGLAELERYSTGAEGNAISTGFESVDRALWGGFKPGEVYLLGAPTGGGKTTLMQMFATGIAAKGPVLFVTPEMSLESMALRATIQEANTGDEGAALVGTEDLAPWKKYQSQQAQKDRAWASIVRAVSRIMERKLPIVIYDDPEATMDKIEEKASKVRGLRAVIIDYAQQVAGVDSKMPRYLQVGEVATRATVMAKRLGVPVLLASQVNRSISKEDGGAPGRPAYKFRETEMLSHKASVVVIFDRREERNPTEDDRDIVPCFIRCEKNRHGKLFKEADVNWYPAQFLIREAAQTTVSVIPPEQIVAADDPQQALFGIPGNE